VENLEIRVLSTGKGWRVDTHKIGALETRTIARAPSKEKASAVAIELARSLQRMGRYGYVRLMIEELF